jgi:hypothetical protein
MLPAYSRASTVCTHARTQTRVLALAHTHALRTRVRTCKHACYEHQATRCATANAPLQVQVLALALALAQVLAQVPRVQLVHAACKRTQGNSSNKSTNHEPAAPVQRELLEPATARLPALFVL